MFGKTESITDPECAPNFFPDYREIPPHTEKARWIDRICPNGEWEANLFQFYRRVLPKLTSVLPKPFQLDNDTRIDETPTHIAIREAFVNALVHSDFSVDANIVIEHYSNQFVFPIQALFLYHEGNILQVVKAYAETSTCNKCL